MFVFVCTNVVFIKKPKQEIMLLYVLGSEHNLHLYFPLLSQWGKIKKSESNDGRTDSELSETGAWEGTVAHNSAKKR